jgi:hypothetical protein
MCDKFREKECKNAHEVKQKSGLERLPYLVGIRSDLGVGRQSAYIGFFDSSHLNILTISLLFKLMLTKHALNKTPICHVKMN